MDLLIKHFGNDKCRICIVNKIMDDDILKIIKLGRGSSPEGDLYKNECISSGDCPHIPVPKPTPGPGPGPGPTPTIGIGVCDTRRNHVYAVELDRTKARGNCSNTTNDCNAFRIGSGPYNYIGANKNIVDSSNKLLHDYTKWCNCSNGTALCMKPN